MIRAGVGYSYLADPQKAALEAADMAMGEASLVRADAALFFCTYAHANQLKEISQEIAQVTAAKEIAGCTGFGILAGTTEIEQGMGLSVMVLSSDQFKTKSFFIKPAPKTEPLSAQKIVQEVRLGTGPDNVGILFPDFSQTHPELLLNALYKLVPKDQWVGGCPSSTDSAQPTYVVSNAQAGSKCLSGLCLSGNFRSMVGIAQGAVPVGKTYTITNSKENLILELDSKPAYEALVELAKKTSLPAAQDPQSWIFMALSPVAGKGPMAREEFFVRNILGVDPKKGIIAVASHIQEDQRVCFALRDPALAREDLRMLAKRMKRDLPGPVQFGLYFNCCARGNSLYKATGVDSAIIEEELGKFPLAGFFTYGEIGPILGQPFLHNYSGVLFLVCA